MANLEPEYVVARRVLLDGLQALEPHLPNLVLVGAQAVYVRASETELLVPLMTTDGDLTVDTDALADEPEIGESLRSAGFVLGAQPGHWVGPGDVALDLMVAPHQAGATSKSARAARIPPHEKMTARIAHGLEPALIDSTVETIAAFEPTDRRSFRLRVAGPAALLVAKAVKLGERLAQEDARPDRVSAKDALDAFRLLQTASAEELVAGFSLHATVAEASEASREALALYREHGVAANGRFPRLAASAAGDDPAIAPSFAALVNELLAALGS
ncbi:MAG: hypothetical protein NVV57_03780 [Demequina sp.]|jgi:hypothetical protein|nr:hypothetical protein [Demequina sp.]